MRLFKKMWRLVKWLFFGALGLFLLFGLPDLLADGGNDRLVIRFGEQTEVYAFDQFPRQITIDGYSLQKIPPIPALPTVPPVNLAPPEPPPPATPVEAPVIIIDRGADPLEIMDRLGNIVGSLALIALGTLIIRRSRRQPLEKTPDTLK